MAAIYANQVVLGAGKTPDSQTNFLESVEPGGSHNSEGTPTTVLQHRRDSSTVYARAGPQHHNTAYR
jgi:hypothetical protein